MIKRERFNPRFWGIFSNPFYFARKALFEVVNELGKELNGRVLDLGCGESPYRRYLSYEEYIGLEVNPQYEARYYDGKRIPFGREFDSVLLTEVFEHVFEPKEFLREIGRVLRPGGRMLMTVPFVWDEHEQPKDYARYTSFGLKYILERNGFKVLEQRKTLADSRAFFQMINEWVYKKTYVQHPIIRQVLNTLLISPLTIMGLILWRFLPKNEDFYIDNVILAEKT